MDQSTGSAPRKSGGVLKWVALGCGLMLLLGIGFFAVSVYMISRSVTTDAGKSETIAQEIVSFEKPAGMHGEFGLAMMGVKMAALTSRGGAEPIASMVLFTIPGGKTNKDELRRQMNTNLEKQGRSHNIVEHKPDEKFKVRGQEVEAKVEVTADSQGTRSLQYGLAIDGAGGNLVLLMLIGGEKTLDHDSVQRFLDTIK